MKMNCEIVEDLLPLYVDDVCSDQSKVAVEDHLQECDRCRKLIETLRVAPIAQIEPDWQAEDKAVKKSFNKIRVRWWTSLIIILAIIPVLFLGWNEMRCQGVAFSNLDELVRGHAFMKCLSESNYEKAYSYFDLDEKKQEWLEEWFEEDDLTSMEMDGCVIFCELGKKLDAAGGIENYEYIDISTYAVESDGTKVYSILYAIQFNGKQHIVSLAVSNDGVEHFNGGGSYFDDPLAQFSIWSEFLWQDYKDCYFDPEANAYIYHGSE